MHGSEALDLIHVAQRGGDHVKAFHEHGAVSRRDLEGPDAVARADFLRDQVDRELDATGVVSESAAMIAAASSGLTRQARRPLLKQFE